MVFAGGGGSVAGLTEKNRQAFQILEALKAMVAVLVSVLTGAVVVKTGQDYRAASRDATQSTICRNINFWRDIIYPFSAAPSGGSACTMY